MQNAWKPYKNLNISCGFQTLDLFMFVYWEISWFVNAWQEMSNVTNVNLKGRCNQVILSGYGNPHLHPCYVFHVLFGQLS